MLELWFFKQLLCSCESPPVKHTFTEFQKNACSDVRRCWTHIKYFLSMHRWPDTRDETLHKFRSAHFPSKQSCKVMQRGFYRSHSKWNNEICSQAAGSAAERCGRHICGRRWSTWVIKLLLKSVRRRGKKCCSTSVWSKWPCCHICAHVSKAIKCMVFFSSRSMNSTGSSPLQSFTSRACSTSQKVFVLKHPVLAGSRENG